LWRQPFADQADGFSASFSDLCVKWGRGLPRAIPGDVSYVPYRRSPRSGGDIVAAADGPIPEAWIVANIVLGGGLLSTRVGSAAGDQRRLGDSLGPTARPNNCVLACPGLCRLVPRPRLHAPSGQRKWDTRGFSRTGRDGSMRSDNAESDGTDAPRL
jgi:hypothetical protein